MSAHAPRDRSRLALTWYFLVRLLAFSYYLLTGGIRVTGRENVPRTGGALIASNHLSFLDVFALGLAAPRPLNYVARASLFKPLLGLLIRSVGGFAIDREGSGTAGLKESLRRLRSGSLVLLFPEGTRSPDGRVGPFKPGFAALARARVPIVPTALAGTFEAWPRGRALPRRHPIRVHFGPPIPPETIASLTSEALTALLRDQIRDCHHLAAAALRRDLASCPPLPPAAEGGAAAG